MPTVTIEGVSYAYDLLVEGDNQPNSIVGAVANEAVYGYQQADTLSGAGGADILIGGAGNDTLVGSSINAQQSTIVGDGTVDAFAFDFTVTQGAAGSTDEVFSLGPPSANANWKAWEQYEGRLAGSSPATSTTQAATSISSTGASPSSRAWPP
jgi:Ca2+-binding RTX toxin-like protein